MRLPDGKHLAYCTNIHAGETWPEVFGALKRHALAVKAVLCRNAPFAIGLRLGALAAKELSDKETLAAFRRWLDDSGIYVFTINGFVYGNFHGKPVKERAFEPDWTSLDRLDYTCLLFDLLAELLPPGCTGSVSTLPGSLKELVRGAGDTDAICGNLLRCATHIADLCESRGIDLHLGLEPEPLGLIETTAETLRFFDRAAGMAPDRATFLRRVGVTYDTCHLAVEFEKPAPGLDALANAGIRLSKINLSSALAATPGSEARQKLEAFADDVYLHQVVAARSGRVVRRYRDLPDALKAPKGDEDEWRIHFHIPLHSAPGRPFRDTRDHLQGTLAWLKDHPDACEHLEMETSTWDVLPADLKAGSVVQQLLREYRWVLGEFGVSV